jgi:hypothetical protein
VSAASLVRHAEDRWLGLNLGYRVARHTPGPAGRRPRVAIDFQHDGLPFDIRVSRLPGGFRASYAASAPRPYIYRFRAYLRTWLFWLNECPPEVTGFTVNGSDGHEASLARFAASADPRRFVLVPDPHYLRGWGFPGEARLGTEAPPWPERAGAIIWRGATNGIGRMSFNADEQDDPTVLQRVRMIMKLAGAADCDVRFSRISDERGLWSAAMDRFGLAAAPLPAQTWLGQKFALDIDGYTNTWSNLLIRMLFGCCVLKVDSQFGFRQWYYDRIRPFEHYVPVKADMSDLAARIDWVRSHDAEARQIAAAGQAFARTLDFETVRRQAAAIITANWDKTA